MTDLQKTLLSLLIIAVLVVSGFFLGRCTVDIKENVVTEYVKGETVHDTIYKPKPVYIDRVKNVDTLSLLLHCINSGLYDDLFPTKTKDSLIYMPVDTMEILKDWLAVRDYKEKLFDNDSLGNCVVSARVQYNRLQNLGYEYTPVTKVVTETLEKKVHFSPYFSVGSSFKGHGLVQGGVFINDYGLAYQYQYGFIDKTSNHSLMFSIKF